MLKVFQVSRSRRARPIGLCGEFRSPTVVASCRSACPSGIVWSVYNDEAGKCDCTESCSIHWGCAAWHTRRSSFLDCWSTWLSFGFCLIRRDCYCRFRVSLVSLRFKYSYLYLTFITVDKSSNAPVHKMFVESVPVNVLHITDVCLYGKVYPPSITIFAPAVPSLAYFTIISRRSELTHIRARITG